MYFLPSRRNNVKQCILISADKRLLWLAVSAQLCHSICPALSSSVSSFSQESSFFQAYFPCASTDCVITITPCSCHGDRWSVFWPWAQIEHIWWHKQNEAYESQRMCAPNLSNWLIPVTKGRGCRKQTAVWQRQLYEHYCNSKWEPITDIV